MTDIALQLDRFSIGVGPVDAQHLDAVEPLLILRDLSLVVPAGTRLGIVGESGSGKSTLLRAWIGAVGQGLFVTHGTALTAGHDLFSLADEDRRQLLGSTVAMVPQSVAMSLTPHLSVAQHFAEVLGQDADRTSQLLDEVGLNGDQLRRRFAHELSGGQQQRVLIALGLARDPHIVLLDEPTSALDVGVVHDILTMIAEAQQRRGFTLVCVSHDLSVIDRVADRVVVMKRGEIVEDASREQMNRRPSHPYTAELLAAAPTLGIRHVGAGSGTAIDRVVPTPIVRAEALSVVRSSARHRLGRANAASATTAVDALTLEVFSGEILGVIGESGSGKSTLLKTICGLLPPTGGTVQWADGFDLATPVERRPIEMLRRIQMVFQNPDDSLNPAHTVRRLIDPSARRPWSPFGGGSKTAHDETLRELLNTVGLAPEMLERRGAKLSGGEKQRVAIARALAMKPELLLLDEVTSALDVTVQAGVLATLLDIHRRLATTMVFVSHDIAVVASIADRIVVLRNGRLVEVDVTNEVLSRPRDPYTARLIELARRTSTD